jgi:cell division septum initiation protein DivIVA
MPRPQDDVVPLHEPFETALRGFNRQQVLAYIESLDGHISMVSADRESALTQVAELSRTLDHLREESELLAHLRQAAEAANEQAERLQKSPMFAAGTRVQRIVRLAEEEAAELMTRTEQEIATIKSRTDQEITERRKRAAHEAETLLQNTTQRCKQLEAEAEERCRAAEEAAEREIARREAEANARIQANEWHSIGNLELLLRIIGPQLAERVAAIKRQETGLAELRARAGQEVSALETFRDELTAQLTSTRQVLADALEQVQQTQVEHPEPALPVVPVQRDGRPGGDESGQQESARPDGRKSSAASA